MEPGKAVGFWHSFQRKKRKKKMVPKKAVILAMMTTTLKMTTETMTTLWMKSGTALTHTLWTTAATLTALAGAVLAGGNCCGATTGAASARKLQLRSDVSKQGRSGL